MVFGKLFNRFKKEEDPKYYDLKVTDLKKGLIFDYNMKSWSVAEESDCDWGNNFFTKEYVIDAGDEKGFLNVSDDTELSITFSKFMNPNSIDPKIRRDIVQFDEPSDQIDFNGESYFLDEMSQGHVKEVDESDWTEMVVWDYYNKSGDKILSLTRWSEQKIEAFVGIVVKDFEISNIIGTE